GNLNPYAATIRCRGEFLTLQAMSFASFAGSFKSGNCRAVIAPDNLMETADPEQGLSLAAQVAKHLVELHRTLEQRQLPRVLRNCPGSALRCSQQLFPVHAASGWCTGHAPRSRAATGRYGWPAGDLPTLAPDHSARALSPRAAPGKPAPCRSSCPARRQVYQLTETGLTPMRAHAADRILRWGQ